MLIFHKATATKPFCSLQQIQIRPSWKKKEGVRINSEKWGQISCLCLQIHVHMPQCL